MPGGAADRGVAGDRAGRLPGRRARTVEGAAGGVTQRNRAFRRRFPIGHRDGPGGRDRLVAAVRDRLCRWVSDAVRAARDVAS